VESAAHPQAMRSAAPIDPAAVGGRLNRAEGISDERSSLEASMGRKINLLLVDDSRTVLAQLERILGEIDDLAIVGMARNGAAAIRMANESKPDLVLMDIVMPGLDGLSALRTIRSLHPDMHVAMISSVSGDSTKAEEAFKLGACQVLGKPFDSQLIEALIESVRAELMHRLDVGREGE
jgi:two-component system chemotaxis response regulator CheY